MPIENVIGEVGGGFKVSSGEQLLVICRSLKEAVCPCAGVSLWVVWALPHCRVQEGRVPHWSINWCHCTVHSVPSPQISVGFLFLLGFWLFLVVSPQRREWLQLPFCPDWGTCPLLVPQQHEGRGTEQGVPRECWRHAQLQGALAGSCFPRAALWHKEMLARPQERKPQVALLCNLSLTWGFAKLLLFLLHFLLLL